MSRTNAARCAPLAGQAISLVKISCFDPTVVSKPEYIPIEQVYVPVKRRKSLDAELVKRLAESILDVGQETPILVRRDKDRQFVLLDGLHRLEACKALGETAIMALIGSVGDFAEGKPNYELAAEIQRQTMERLKKLRLQREAAQKTEAIVQPLSKCQMRLIWNLGRLIQPSAQAQGLEPQRQKHNPRPCRNGLRDKNAREAVTNRTRYVRSPEGVLRMSAAGRS